MRLSLTTLIALSCGTLALPHDNTNTPTLPPSNTSPLRERCDGAGSIAAFDSFPCAGSPIAGPSGGSLDVGGCISFSGSNSTNYVGVNWGSGSCGRANKIMVFKDQHCSEHTRRETASAPNGDSPIGMNACISMEALYGPWGSVIFNHTSG